jgi:NADPH:quinone reductase-like Zn-dependent oxidoreductase
MKAIRCREWGDPRLLRLEEIDLPEPRAGEAVVRVRAAALNYPDWLIVQGKYQVKPDLPFTPGFEVAGTVEALGAGVKEPAVGTRVLANTPTGGFAEFARAPAHLVRPIPESMSDEEAAGFTVVYQTAYVALRDRARMEAGESVLVFGASGGVGIATIQMARALGAGRAIAATGSKEKAERLRSEGADDVLFNDDADFAARVKEATGGRGADVIVDPVGGEMGERAARCLAYGGRHVLVGFTSGRFPQLPANLILIKNVSVVGLHWSLCREREPQKVLDAWSAAFDFYSRGALRPVVGARFAFERVAEAMECLTSRRAFGKIVLHW